MSVSNSLPFLLPLPNTSCLPSCHPVQLKQEELQLLRPVAQRGQRETKKQALKRALQLQRAGVSLPSDVQLLQERERPAAAMGEAESDDASSGSDDEDEEEEEQQQQRQRGAEMAGSDSGSELDGEGAAPAAKRQRIAGAQQQVRQAVQQLPKAAAATAAGKPQQAEQQAAASAAAEQKRQAAALREAAEATKAQLGVSQQRDEEFPQQAQRAGQGMPAGPGGQPRVVMVQRRPEIQEVRCGMGGGSESSSLGRQRPRCLEFALLVVSAGRSRLPFTVEPLSALGIAAGRGCPSPAWSRRSWRPC